MHKKNELQEIFKDHKILLPSELGITFSFEENGKTYFENSYGKAKALFDIIKRPVLADDSGLSVDYLNGAPGIFSARFGNVDNEITQKQKNLLVLENLKNVSNRDAAFICCLVFIQDKYNFISIQESLAGEIADRECGENGFGYDPIFKLKDKNITVAQLSEKEKNTISHRAKAGKKLNKLLGDYYGR